MINRIVVTRPRTQKKKVPVAFKNGDGVDVITPRTLERFSS